MICHEIFTRGHISEIEQPRRIMVHVQNYKEDFTTVCIYIKNLVRPGDNV